MHGLRKAFWVKSTQEFVDFARHLYWFFSRSHFHACEEFGGVILEEVEMHGVGDFQD